MDTSQKLVDEIKRLGEDIKIRKDLKTINDISKNNRVSDAINRELKIIYFESF